MKSLRVFGFMSFLRVIRVWTLAGDVIYTLSDHNLDAKSGPSQKAFVYCLSVLPSQVIVSGGEDYSVSIWRGELYLFILYPSVEGLTAIVRW